MGWIKSRCYRIGVGIVQSDTQVYEPKGYTGEWLTPCGQDHKKPENRMRIKRNGRKVY